MPVGGPHRENWPTLPLSRTVHTVLVFAARGTCGSSTGCGNQRRNRLRQYEKSGLTPHVLARTKQHQHGDQPDQIVEIHPLVRAVEVPGERADSE